MKIVFSKSKAGFTLVEIMVVLAIVVLLSALILSGYSEGRSRLAVERTAEGFLSDLHRVRQRGFSGVGYEVNGVVVGSAGHGIDLDLGVDQGDSYYILYAKNDSDEEIIEKIEIEERVSISGLFIGDNNPQEIKVFFEKGGGFKVNGNPVESVKIVFSARNDDSIKRSIIINNNGIAKISYE